MDIVSKHKVELLGWPTSIKFANPSEIGNVEDIQKLHQALRARECKWVVHSQAQQASFTEKLSRREAAGEQVEKKRKQRSDKGKLRVSKGSKSGREAALGQGGKGSRKKNLAKVVMTAKSMRSPGSR